MTGNLDQLTITLSRSYTTPTMLILTISKFDKFPTDPAHYISTDELGFDYVRYTIDKAIRDYVSSVRADQ